MSDLARRTRVLVCNCQKTMRLDGARLARDLGLDAPLEVQHELCRSQLAHFEAALDGETPLLVACTQEAPLFREVAEEQDAANPLAFTNIRERAGWTSDAASPLPKIAALLAEAAFVPQPVGATTVVSGGVCLVYGRGQRALDVAAALNGRLSVSVLLAEVGDALPPSTDAVPIAKGRIRSATGTLGSFEIEVDGYAPMLPSSRAAPDFALARNGARSNCDLIIDVTGDAPLFPAGARRDGYLRADSAAPGAVERAMLAASDLVGEFEKPHYVTLDPAICAHARSQKVGCRNCLDHCPTGAISPAGDHVAIDAAICGGCGNCSAVCPTGAVAYAFPTRADLLQRVTLLLGAYARAGGRRPIVLFHDNRHGAPLIAASARGGRGLPAHVLPLALHSTLELGHEILLATLALGAEAVVVLAPDDHPEELGALTAQTALADALLTGFGVPGRRLAVAAERDPDAVEQVLWALPELPALPVATFNVLGGKRELARTALARLRDLAATPVTTIPLPAGAPYGRIGLATSGCTLCLACVGACPAGALSDHPERPQVAFTEAACVQCGICVATCPEKVITLEPRYSFDAAALAPDVLKSEEPFNCITCGKPFGTRATIERVLGRLEGKHAMFRSSDQARLIQMCDTCRITTLSEHGNDPFRLGERPRVRTTEDYLAEREAAAAPKPTKPEDFLS